MIVQLSTWILAAALAQAGPGAAWQKSVPGDIDVVIRTRGLESTRDDVTAMLKALSPSLAEPAGPALEGALGHVREMFGATVTQEPCVVLGRVVPPGANGGGMPIAVLVLKDDYQGVLKSLAGGNAAKPRDGGYDAFTPARAPGTWYGFKGAGFAAFSPDESLIAAVAKPAGSTFDKVLTPALAGPFWAGDVGAYANVSALVTRYAEQIAQGRELLMAQLDQAAQQGGNAAAMAPAKAIYTSLFDSLKYADALTLGLDASAGDLHVSSMLTVKPGSDAAKAIATGRGGTGDDMARLPADATFYMYMNTDAKMFERAQSMSLRMLDALAPGSADLKRAKDAFRDLGAVESVGATYLGAGMRALNALTVRDPKAFIASSRTLFQALKPAPGAAGFYKDIKVEEGVQTYRGFTFDHMVAKLDLDKVAGQNPGGAGGIKQAFGGDTLSNWLGTDGTRVIQATTPSWDDAKKWIDAYLDGKAGLGTTAGYKAVRSLLPGRPGVVMLASAQGIVGLFTAQMAAAGKEVKPAAATVPAGDPVFIGGSLTPVPPAGYEFHLVVPTRVGPVLEKGLAPVLQGAAGGVQR